MNLVSIEEHFFFTAEKTGKKDYLDLLQEVRKMRQDLLKKIIPKYEGEVWCISKHLLAASMRLMEVGTKQLGMGKRKEAEEYFEKAYDLYSLFWGVNMNIVDTNNIQKSTKKPSTTKTKQKRPHEQTPQRSQKAIDCCIE